MDIDRSPNLAQRAGVHRALGDPHRLRIVDALRRSDRTPSELAGLTGLGSNLLAFHLDVLAEAEVITRHRSEGDGRRRYVRLDPRVSAVIGPDPGAPDLTGERVLFVCTANSARSQFAAALWSRVTGQPAESAGSTPADAVHPLAVQVGTRYGLELAERHPRSYREVTSPPQVVVSVCDRAREGGPPPAPLQLHWSVADPVGGDEAAFQAAFDELHTRVQSLARAA
jgi:protein-tyrosine-phosphatase/DNA-binding HxlR family transcriptional regulator